jgi:hypothetical protein
VENDNIITALPNDKSPGLDGFNIEFLKEKLACHQAGILRSLQCFSKQLSVP